MESVVSVALKVADPTVPDFTVKVATPLAFVVSGDPEMVAVPEDTPRLIDFPEMATPFASVRVTVIVEVVVLFGGTETGVAVTVEALALTTMAVKFTVAV